MSKFWARLRYCARVALLTLAVVTLVQRSGMKPGGLTERVRGFTREFEFHYENWILDALQIKAGQVGLGAADYLTDEQQHQIVVDYINLVAAIDQKEEEIATIVIQKEEHKVGVFPISIDYDEFSEGAKRKKVLKKSKELKETCPDQLLMLGVDRLDYTKGIPQKLKAYRMLLEENPELRGRVKLIQILVPSRENISQYADLKSEIEQLVGQINGSFSQPGWIPIQYRYCTIKREEILAYYQACDIALVTPLKDGMNLVAKEYCASRNDESGVLILSEFAGAMHQLKCGALLVNPFDIKSLVSAMKRAISMSKEEQKERMLKLQQNIRSYDIYWWADSFLGAARHVLK